MTSRHLIYITDIGFIIFHFFIFDLISGITKWLDRMYLFKQDTLRDGVIDAKEIEQWKQILNEYEESLKEITTPSNEEKIDFKKIQEQINLLLQQKK